MESHGSTARRKLLRVSVTAEAATVVVVAGYRRAGDGRSFTCVEHGTRRTALPGTGPAAHADGNVRT
ncbi:hypothetical protein [Streptomyces uncialis]|uniref:Uncharacterized protein n=1 Tax=Streptomyces uncialis TaxID=1048205 RepID=A0A1Q4V323_9ACTN|nr:hypothetical protein [Streptomyces uncialis]MCX4657819.1 hypothetical protein [Streptomyces uncialis]OKH92233.1 hypothetical protein AB852_25235 [Streptomyces uncialis]